jgi:hypothetical protein
MSLQEREITIAPDVTATVKFELDTEGYYTRVKEDYGEFVPNLEDFIIDRRFGALYGGYTSFIAEFATREEAEKYSHDVAFANYPIITSPDGKLKVARTETHSSHYDPNDTAPFTVEVEGHEVLAIDPKGGVFIDRNACQWVKPHDRYTVTDDMPDDEKQQTYGYWLEDWRRLEDYENQQWYVADCVATVYVHGIEVGSDAMGGIESDGDDSYHNEVVEQVLDEAIEKARKNLAKLKSSALPEVINVKALLGLPETEQPE